MDNLKNYSIEFKGLKDAKYDWDFDLTPAFFELYENSLVQDGNFKCKVLLDKTPTLLTFNFDIKGETVQSCDDCLDDIVVPISTSRKLYVKFGEEYEEQSDEILVIERNEHQINIAQYIYEFIILSLPLRVVHPDDENGNSTCNPIMLERLSNYLVSEVDESSAEYEDESDEQGEDSGEIDPRWSSLKNLIDNNKKEV